MVKVRRDIADLIKVLGTHLTDVKIDHMAIVGIDLVELFRVQ